MNYNNFWFFYSDRGFLDLDNLGCNRAGHCAAVCSVGVEWGVENIGFWQGVWSDVRRIVTGYVVCGLDVTCGGSKT